MENNPVEKAKTYQLSAAVEYVDKSIVSKQVIKSPAGNITLFAFDKDEGLSEHSAPFDAFVQVIDGSAEIIIGGIKNLLQTGEFIIIPANTPHEVKAVKKFKMMLAMIKA